MNRFLIIVACSCISVVPAIAAQIPAVVPPQTTQDTIVVSAAVDLLNALVLVTGNHEQVIGQGASQKAVMVPYSFSAETTWALSDDITVLRKFVTNVQTTLNHMREDAEAKNGGPLRPKKEAVLNAAGVVVEAAERSSAQRALDEETQKFMESKKPVDKLFLVSRDDLKLGDNHFPGASLSALAPILKK